DLSVGLEVGQQTRLADSSFAFDEGRRAASGGKVGEHRAQGLALGRPADEPAAERIPRLEPAIPGIPEQPNDPNGPGLAAEHLLAEIVDGELLPGRPAGRLVEEDLAGLRDPLDS